MQKTTSKKPGRKSIPGAQKVFKKSISIEVEDNVFIDEEIASQEALHGYRITRSAVIKAALKLLRAKRQDDNPPAQNIPD